MADMAKVRAEINGILDGGGGEEEILAYLSSIGLTEKDVLGKGGAAEVTAGPTLEERTEQVYGMTPDAGGKDRLGLWPYPADIRPDISNDIVPERVVKDIDDIDWSDWIAPQWLYGLAKSSLLPGHVLEGGDYTRGDVNEFALNFAVPAAMRGGRGGVGGMAQKRTARDRILKNAPSVEELSGAATGKYGAAEAGNAIIASGPVATVLAELEALTVREGAGRLLHPKINAVLRALLARTSKVKGMQSRTAKPMTIKDLQVARRQIGIAARSAEPDERRIASMMQDHFDDWFAGLKEKDLLSGSAEGSAALLGQARGLWARSRKAQIIEETIEGAKAAASGFENGLRMGFRALLKNEKKIRGFSDAERKQMKQLVKGTPTQNMLRFLGLFAPGASGRGIVGATIGAGGGAAVGGAPGAMAAMLGGTAARLGAQNIANKQAAMIQAMAASGMTPAAATRLQGLLSAANPAAQATSPVAAGLLSDRNR